jgi:single-strand DNA-binding protein
MIQCFASGNLTRDAAIRQAGNDDVCSFSIACNRRVKGEESVTFLDCSLWGNRGAKLVEYLKKGTRVCVVGEMSTREHNGKTYLQIRVSELDFAGGGKSRGESKQDEPTTQNDDDIGF